MLFEIKGRGTQLPLPQREFKALYNHTICLPVQRLLCLQLRNSPILITISFVSLKSNSSQIKQ